MKKRTFNIPTVDGIDTREGFRVWLDFGGAKRAFMLQLESSGGRPCILSDFATGFRLANLSSRMLQWFVSRPSVFPGESVANWRVLAQEVIDGAVRAKGIDTLRAMLASVPVINV